MGEIVFLHVLYICVDIYVKGNNRSCENIWQNLHKVMECCPITKAHIKPFRVYSILQ